MSREPEETPDDELVAEDDAIIGKAFRVSLLVLLILGGGGALLVWFLGREEAAPPPTESQVTAPRVEESVVVAPVVRFTDVTGSAGITFRRESGARGDKLLPETMGGGSAFFDQDGDGDPDLLLVNGMPWPENVDDSGERASQAFYRNDGAGRFTDETSAVGLDETFYGMGAAVGDVDCDGDPDVFFTVIGPNRLYAFDGGRYTLVERGVQGDPTGWTSCAAFFDADGDGDLDLYSGDYVRWSRDIDFEVDYRLTGIGRSYGPPTNFEGADAHLFRNRGDGTFDDVSEEAGMHVANPATGRPIGKALGVRPLDVEGDGDMDLFVANDTVQNFFFRNDGSGKFEEVGDSLGVAFDRDGSATGAMGIDAAWYRNDEALGFAIGNFANEMSSLYVSQGTPDFYADEAIGEGVGAPSRMRLSFGLFFFDYDLDGRIDLLQANGHLEDEISKVQQSQSYEQPAQLFWNAGPDSRACFLEVAPETTGDLGHPIVGRGANYADFDGDGDLDVLLTQTGDRPLLLRNDQVTGHRWLRIRLAGPSCNPTAIGARLELYAAGGIQRRDVMPTRSYLSQVETTVTFGLGETSSIERLVVHWPDGETTEHTGLAPDRVHVLSR